VHQNEIRAVLGLVGKQLQAKCASALPTQQIVEMASSEGIENTLKQQRKNLLAHR
jgi:hypothetical protein